MNPRDLRELLLLGGLWGASFLFMRMGAVDFGPWALVLLRVAGASLMLLPLLLMRGEGAALRKHWRAIALVGIVNSVGPFLLFTMAALVLGTALMSVFNSTVPIWAALVAWAWLGERPTVWRMLGLGIGIAGVVGLAWGKADLRPGDHGISAALGIAACIAGAMLYGLGANLTRHLLTGVPPMAVATGSQCAATVVVAVPAAFYWPATMPGAQAWMAAAALAFACTGLAYVLYFRLIAHAGTAGAVSVTFLIPTFAIAWGWLFLSERPTVGMLTGCAVILLGTALATGLLPRPARRPPPLT